MAISATELRANIYRLLDQVLETGAPLEVERKGRRVRIVPVQAVPRLDGLVRREDFVAGDPDTLVHVDWAEEWKP